jgi:curved DNA-binding protein CbpA
VRAEGQRHMRLVRALKLVQLHPSPFGSRCYSRLRTPSPSAGKTDHYAVLGVERGCEPGVLRSRYAELVRALHPDTAQPKSRISASDATSASQLDSVLQAYAVLRDPARRAAHDASLRLVQSDWLEEAVQVATGSDGMQLRGCARASKQQLLDLLSSSAPRGCASLGSPPCSTSGCHVSGCAGARPW